MGKIIKLFDDEEPQKEEEVKPLTQEEIQELIEPMRRKLKELYPSQVREVVGLIGFGEKYGSEVFLAGILIWEHLKYEQPIASSFLAVFNRGELEKISFLEAKNNYWDWKLMVKTYRDRFHTEEILKGLYQLREKFSKGEL
ncbi:MAG: hypothetical protein GXN96_00540 [Aquificae bacterium]|nr:hypothetical protein [Aquificota bacterium]